MSLYRFPPFFLLSAACLAAQTTAGEGTASPPAHEEPLQLENVVVTASPYARSQLDLAQPTNVLAGRDLLLQSSTSLGELLSGTPGVSSSYFGPGASRPVIRGLGGDRVRILENGAGTLDASVNSPDHAVSLDPLLIERVEVVRGPATLLYGGSAVGGVVNVIDHRIHTALPDAALNVRSELRAASANDERSGGLVLEGAAGAFAWHLDGYRRDSTDVEIPGFAESAALRAAEAAEAAEHGESPSAEVAGTIPNTAITADGGAFGFSYIGSRGYVGWSYSGHNTIYGVPSGAHEHAEDAGEDESAEGAEEGPVRLDLRQRRLDVQGELTAPFAGFERARFKLGVARYRHQELEDDEIGTVFTNHGFDGRLELLHAPLAGFTGALGWQGGRSDFSAVGAEAFLPPTRTDTHALFVFEEREFKPFAWQLGARVERQTVETRDATARERRTTPLSASTGLVWTLDSTWSLGASLAHSARAANAQELYADGPHIGTNAYEIGDPALDPEKSTSLDLTLRKRTGFVTASLTAFASQFDGYIYEQPTGEVADGLTVYRFVQRDARFTGAELETIFHLYHGNRQTLDFTVTGDLVRGRNRTDDTHLPRITPTRVKTGLVWTRGPLAIGTEVQFVGAQRRVAPYETTTGRYALLGAYVSRRFTLDRLELEAFVRGTNLGDEEARLHTSFLKDVAPLPGRNVTVGMRASF